MAYNTNTKLLLQFTEADGATATFDKSALFRCMETIGTVEVFTGGGPNGMNCLTCGDPGGENVQGLIRAIRATPAKLYDMAIGGSMRFDFHFRKLVDDGSYQYLFGWGCSGDKYFRLSNPADNSTLVFEAQLWDGTDLKTYTKTAISGGLLNTWHHLRIYINYYTLVVGLDGVEIHSSSNAADSMMPMNQDTYPFTLFDIGGFEGQKFLGNIAGFQYLQNDESWTGGAYTVPTAPYDEAPIPENNYDSTTALQLLFNSATIEDTSTFQHPITVEGSAYRVSNDDPYGTGSLHVGEGGAQGGISVNSPGSILSDQYGNHVLDMWMWHDSSGTSNDFLFSMEDPVGGFLLRSQCDGYSVVVEWYGNNYADYATISTVLAMPRSDAWHHVRLVLGNSMLILAVDGVEGQRYNTPGLLFSDYSAVTLMEFGRYTSNYYFTGRLNAICLRHNDYSYYDGGANNGGPYVVPQLEPMKAALAGPVTVGLAGQSFDYAQGAFGVGLPVSFPVTGQSFAYALGNFKLRYDPKKGDATLFGSHYAGRLVGDDLVPKSGQEDVAKLANDFWEAPAAPSANVTAALSGLSYAVDPGAITAVNPTRVVALAGQSITYAVGAITKNVGGPITVGLTGQTAAFSQGVLGRQTTVGVPGVQSNHVLGNPSAGSSKTLTGQAVPIAAGDLLPSPRPALAGQSIAYTQGTLGVTNVADYDYNTRFLVKCNEANGATILNDTSLSEEWGVTTGVAAITSSQGVFGSNSLAVGNPGGTREYYSYGLFNGVSGSQIWGMFVDADNTVPKQFDIWWRPTTGGSNVLFSVSLNNVAGHFYVMATGSGVSAQYMNGNGTQRAYCYAARANHLNTWRHYRLLLDGNIMRLGYNGAEVAATDIGTPVWTGNPLNLPYATDVSEIRLGRPAWQWDSTDYDFMAAQGYLDTFVITAGAGVSWVGGGAYTVPTFEPTDAPEVVANNATGDNTTDAVTSTGAGYALDSRSGEGANTVDDCLGSGLANHDTMFGEGANTLADFIGEGSAAQGVVIPGAGSAVLDNIVGAMAGVLTPISIGTGAATTESITSIGEGGLDYNHAIGANTTETMVSVGSGSSPAYSGPTGVGANTTATISSVGAGKVAVSGEGENTITVSSFGDGGDRQFGVGASVVESTITTWTAKVETLAAGVAMLNDVASTGAGIGIFFGNGSATVAVSAIGYGVAPITGTGVNTTESVTTQTPIEGDIYAEVFTSRPYVAAIAKPAVNVFVRTR